ncbi:hypothetical protein V5T82_03270 [Magnetovibrio sp. PR-2]|uniref:hypothetical protein n=1 Tax=Magnetovibrio sp. PR-2 TaxID=3120356 RepID=UPI002FCE43A3
MMKSIKLALIGIALTFSSLPAHAETPQTDAAFVEMMKDAPAEKVLEALDLYYQLHVSELNLQYMNERRTGAFFAMRRAQQKGAGAVAKAEKHQKAVVAKREQVVEDNKSLRLKLEAVSGVEFLDDLVMIPDAPLAKPQAPVGAPADLIKAQAASWDALQAAQTKWQDERLILLDAQQRYDETRDVPIGDHLRAMTAAEMAYAKAVGECRLIEAKIAIATGKPIPSALSGL